MNPTTNQGTRLSCFNVKTNYFRKRLFTDTVPVNKMHLTDTVSVNKMHLTGTLYGKPFSKTSKTCWKPSSIQTWKLRGLPKLRCMVSIAKYHLDKIGSLSDDTNRMGRQRLNSTIR